ncbi:hypothetical protein [Cellulosimicrobium protaetiae]|uniref:Gram-positive cocci surface proteins LPxTG domain-containing protein n=1 Tax=Cellulosimicrobium protaetiae TaxID=2587808 RepID=A0A6M5UKW7_9MICO|nr:hypothetical protein [Cellulosimicrobium protaetiae]QJW37881.1 hypothetical protein FIC82_018610 [Cellulosimicrobium protaetiae]
MIQRTARASSGTIGLLAVLLVAGPAALPAMAEESGSAVAAAPANVAPTPADDAPPGGTGEPAVSSPSAGLGPASLVEGAPPEPVVLDPSTERVLDVDRTTFTDRDRADGFVFTGTGFTPGADVVFWVPAGGEGGADLYEAVPVGDDGGVEFHLVPGRSGDEGSTTGPGSYRVWVEERLAPDRYASVGWYTLTLVAPVVEVDRATFTDDDREEGFLLSGSGFVPGATVLVDVAYTGIDLSTMHHEVIVDDAGGFAFRFVPGGPHPEHPDAQPNQYVLFVRQVVDGRAEPVDWVYLDRVVSGGATPVPPGALPGDQGATPSPAPVASPVALAPGDATSVRTVDAEAPTALAATGVDARTGTAAVALVGAGAALLVLRRLAARRRADLV